jgi:hypothetical protein
VQWLILALLAVAAVAVTVYLAAVSRRFARLFFAHYRDELPLSEDTKRRLAKELELPLGAPRLVDPLFNWRVFAALAEPQPDPDLEAVRGSVVLGAAMLLVIVVVGMAVLIVA